jgi:hypothetical protein
MTKRLAETPFLFPDDGDGETEPFLVRVPRKQDTSRKQDPSPRKAPSSKQDHSPREDPLPKKDNSRKETTEPPTWSSPSDLVWEDQIKRISRPTPRPIETGIEWDLVSNLKGLRLSAIQLEADLFIGPGSIGSPNERPLALYMLMLADRHSGMIVGFEALTAEDSFEMMYASIPRKVVDLLLQNKMLPKQIIVRSDLLLALLEPLENSRSNSAVRMNYQQ